MFTFSHLPFFPWESSSIYSKGYNNLQNSDHLQNRDL
jgi:hypothetical protein